MIIHAKRKLKKRGGKKIIKKEILKETLEKFQFISKIN